MPIKIQKNNFPTLAIIGRVNVGKSTLFNKLIEQRKALVSEIPGTTRDLNFGIAEWQHKKFNVIDTGGIFEIKSKKAKGKILEEIQNDSIEYQVEKKAREIIDKADLVLMMVDAHSGLTTKDRLIAQFIKQTKKSVLVVVNKTDKNKFNAHEFKKLGLGEAQSIAAISGVGIGDLLDKIIKTLKHFNILTSKHKNTIIQENKNIKPIKISIIGKPNVGKSSLLNQILGEEKVIVSSTPHTTREPQNTLLEFEGRPIELIDTAGIRKKSKVLKSRKAVPTLESQGINMSVAMLKKSHVALFVLDVSENFTAQDAELAQLIVDSGVSVIFVANKYDTLEKDEENIKILNSYIHNFFPFIDFAPIIATSAKSGRNCQKILSLILEVYKERIKIIPDTEVKEFMDYLMKKMPPPKQTKIFGGRKRRAFITKIYQKKTDRPIFIIDTNNKIKIPETYLRYLENNLRNRYKFTGTPIKIAIERNVKMATANAGQANGKRKKEKNKNN